MNKRLVLSGALLISGLSLLHYRAMSQQFYFDANCVSKIELEEQCNLSFMRRSMNARFDRGTSTNIKYSNINAWNYTDSSKLKMDTDLAEELE